MIFKILFGWLNGLVCITAIFSISCSNITHTPYQVLLNEELNRGVRYDTLFHGLHFNMRSDAFFTHCFKMNREGIFFQHGGAQEMVMKFDQDFSYPVEFIFYPDFEDDSIVEVPGYFYYTWWNGFNKKYFAQNLQNEVVKEIEDWYDGNPFLKVRGPNQSIGDAYIKIDGNRQIMVWNNSDNRRVDVLFSDLTKMIK